MNGLSMMFDLATKGYPFVVKKLVDQMNEEDWVKAETFKNIVSMSEENNFYVNEISSEILTDLTPAMYRANVVTKYELIKQGDEVCGFYIMYNYTDTIGKAEIKYFFVKPECRRKGLAKETFTKIMSKCKMIYTDTSSEDYVRLITGLGFTEVGKCKKTEEICYKWEKVKKKGKGKRKR
jgi:RimJ/RimL family protein N-acetyltransferase